MAVQFKTGGRTEVLVTTKGNVVLWGPVEPEDFLTFEFDEGLNNFRRAERQKEGFFEAVKKGEMELIVASHGNVVVGYVVLAKPSKFERWEKIKDPCFWELSAEVSSRWRRQGILKRLLAFTLADGRGEDCLIYATGFSWHWDLRGTGLSAFEYGQMLTFVFSRFGFSLHGTNEPNICYDSANIFLVRYGARVSPRLVSDFERLCYEQEEDSFVF